MMLRPILLASAVCGCLAVPGLADDQAPAGSKVLNLADCRIMLIDRVTLASDRPGIIDFVSAREGEAVKADQQIAGLKDEVAQARRAVAQREADNDIEVRYAEKASEVADAEYDKALEVNLKLPSGGIPDIEVRRLKLAAERAVLQIEQAQNQLTIAGLNLEQAEAEMDTYQIVAPFDGVVTMVHKSKGEAVRQGDPILDMVSTSRIRVEGKVNIRDIWSVREGDKVEVRLDIPGEELAVERQTFEGKIVFVDVAVQALTREVRVWAEVENRNSILKEGLYARMKIHASGGPPQGQK